jgi:hypothetical protein
MPCPCPCPVTKTCQTAKLPTTNRQDLLSLPVQCLCCLGQYSTAEYGCRSRSFRSDAVRVSLKLARPRAPAKRLGPLPPPLRCSSMWVDCWPQATVTFRLTRPSGQVQVRYVFSLLGLKKLTWTSTSTSTPNVKRVKVDIPKPIILATLGHIYIYL